MSVITPELVGKALFRFAALVPVTMSDEAAMEGALRHVLPDILEEAAKVVKRAVLPVPTRDELADAIRSLADTVQEKGRPNLAGHVGLRSAWQEWGGAGPWLPTPPAQENEG